MGKLRVRGFVLALSGATLVVSIAACSVEEQLDPGTGVEVRVFKGPIQPVEREGESNVAPVAGAVVLVEPLAGGEARRVSTESAGTARLPVVPGAYRISVEECPGAMAPPKEAETVSVRAGSFASVTLVCDTGIR